MKAARGIHSGDGADTVRRLRKLRFLRLQDSSALKSDSNDLPVFLAIPRPLAGFPEKGPSHEVDGDARVSNLGGGPTTTLVKSFDGSKDEPNRFYSGLAPHRMLPSHMRGPLA